MKRAKKHRKRHLLPGPAGLRQQRHKQIDTGISSNNGNVSQAQKGGGDRNKDDDHNYNVGEEGNRNSNCEDDDNDDDTSRTRNRHNRDPKDDQENEDPQMIHEHIQIWDAMCVSLDRILPHNLNSASNRHGRRHEHRRRQPISNNSIIRQALSTEFSLLSDLYSLLQQGSGSASSSNSPLLGLQIPRIVVQIHTIHSHGHLDYTVELMDETTTTNAVDNSTNTNNGTDTQEKNANPMPIGWLSQSLIRNHPDWIRPGTVFLCQHVSMAVFKTNRNGYSNGGAGFDRMLVLGEDNISYAWTKDNIGDVKNDQYLRLLEKRVDVHERIMKEYEDELDFVDGFIDCGDDDVEFDEHQHQHEHEHKDEDCDSSNNYQNERIHGGRIGEGDKGDNNTSREQVFNRDEDDWSNIPQSSTIDIGAKNRAVVINQGQVLSRTQNKTNKNTEATHQSQSQQCPSNFNAHGTSVSNNNAVASRQTTIVTAPNQRLVNSSSISHSAPSSGVANSREGTGMTSSARETRVQSEPRGSSAQAGTEMSAGSSVSIASNVHTSNAIVNPYAKNKNRTLADNITISQRNSYGDNPSKNTSTRTPTSGLTKTNNHADRNPYLKNTAQVVQISPNEKDADGANMNVNASVSTIIDRGMERSSRGKRQLKSPQQPNRGNANIPIQNPYTRRRTIDSSLAQNPYIHHNQSTPKPVSTPDLRKHALESVTNTVVTNTVHGLNSPRQRSAHINEDSTKSPSDARLNQDPFQSNFEKEHASMPNANGQSIAPPSSSTSLINAEKNGTKPTPIPIPRTITQHSSSEYFHEDQSSNIWSSVQSIGLDMNVFDEEPSLESTRNSMEKEKSRHTSNLETKDATTATSFEEISQVGDAYNRRGRKRNEDSTPLSKSLFSDLGNLQDNEMDGFSEDDD